MQGEQDESARDGADITLDPEAEKQVHTHLLPPRGNPMAPCPSSSLQLCQQVHSKMRPFARSRRWAWMASRCGCSGCWAWTPRGMAAHLAAAVMRRARWRTAACQLGNPFTCTGPWCHGLQADGCSLCLPDTAGAADLDLRAATRWSRPTGRHDVAAGPEACGTTPTGAMRQCISTA